MARIRFEGVSKRYGDVVAVRSLDLEVRDREFVVLLGPSGCGKSTTLNMIAGLEHLSEGELWFDDEIVNDIPPHRRDVAMVFQSYALYPHKTVYENIAFGLRMRGVPAPELDRRVHDAARKLEIASLLGRRPSQLSGGQRQRVALGRAMVRQPAVFLMDEPLSNLDAALRISMRAEIKHLHQEMRTTFVYVTHDQAEALTLADRIVVMKEGLIQQVGTPDQVYDRPANMFVASFLGNPPINYLDGEIEDGSGAPVFRRGNMRIALGPAMLPRTPPSPVVLGIRPEDVLRDPSPDRPALLGVVDSVLPVGSDRFLGLKVEGCDMFVRVDKETHHAPGERVSFGLIAERLTCSTGQAAQACARLAHERGCGHRPAAAAPGGPALPHRARPLSRRRDNPRRVACAFPALAASACAHRLHQCRCRAAARRRPRRRGRAGGCGMDNAAAACAADCGSPPGRVHDAADRQGALRRRPRRLHRGNGPLCRRGCSCAHRGGL